jgi:DnaK suppressor protein
MTEVIVHAGQAACELLLWGGKLPEELNMSLAIRPTVPTRTRHADLKTMLEARRRELTTDIQDGVKRSRAHSAESSDVVDSAEFAEADVQEDLHFVLMQMKVETVTKIDDALTRLESGDFGECVECGGEITEARLRALPFALRCIECERAREVWQRATQAPPRTFASVFFGVN